MAINWGPIWNKSNELELQLNSNSRLGIEIDELKMELEILALQLKTTVKCRYNAVFGGQEIDRVIAVTAL